MFIFNIKQQQNNIDIQPLLDYSYPDVNLNKTYSTAVLSSPRSLSVSEDEETTKVDTKPLSRSLFSADTFWDNDVIRKRRNSSPPTHRLI